MLFSVATKVNAKQEYHQKMCYYDTALRKFSSLNFQVLVNVHEDPNLLVAYGNLQLIALVPLLEKLLLHRIRTAYSLKC